MLLVSFIIYSFAKSFSIFSTKNKHGRVERSQWWYLKTRQQNIHYYCIFLYVVFGVKSINYNGNNTAEGKTRRKVQNVLGLCLFSVFNFYCRKSLNWSSGMVAWIQENIRYLKVFIGTVLQSHLSSIVIFHPCSSSKKQANEICNLMQYIIFTRIFVIVFSNHYFHIFPKNTQFLCSN